jgi:NAD(P)-dependent dehydrogenase (short-subunit alcohol dehydrogenase family)
VAAALAARGMHVTIADRNHAAGVAAAARIRAAAPAAAVEFRPVDLASLAQVRAFADALLADGQPLDLLVNNAGILPSLSRRTSADGFELAFAIAHLGHFALTVRLLPALARAAAPRVVGVTSLVQAWARIDFDDLQAEHRYEPQRAYDQSKLAALMFALELDARARAAGLALASLAAHPGVARTGIGDARLREPPRRLRDRLELWAFRAAMAWIGQPAAAGAQAILHAATAADARGGEFYGPGGFQQWRGAPARVRPSKAARDARARTRLWELSERLTGVRWPA